jgi:hypothetical protein
MAKKNGYAKMSKGSGSYGEYGSSVKQGSPGRWGWTGGNVPASYSYKEQLMQMNKASSVLGKGQSK